jgi:ABC-type oligopeptide transport system substrate-binding subunit
MKKIFITIIVLALLGGGGYMFMQSKADGAKTSTKSKSKSTGVVGSEIFSALNKLDSLSLDTSLFTSPLFKSLIPSTTRLEINDKGKDNPFSTGRVTLVEQPLVEAPAEETTEETTQ